MTIVHVLGADIPHHNSTLLNFFDQILHTEIPTSIPRKFMVVSQDSQLSQRYPNLAITHYPSKRALANAVCEKAREPTTIFFCHGQFNPTLWLALLSGKVKRHQLHWHVWGADLYEESRALKFRLFYLIRRIAQGRVASVFATLGDIDVYRRKHRNIPCHCLYFPTKMPKVTLQPHDDQGDDKLTILLGNSGDSSNHHCRALTQICQQFGQKVKVIVPMGYPENNQAYIHQVQAHAAALFPHQQVSILTDKLNFDEYLRVLRQCDLGYFIFARQQGIGTLSLLIDQNIPIVISRQNPFWQDLVQQQVPVLFDQDPLNSEIIEQARRQLSGLDKSAIAFFAPGYLQGWREMLQRLEGANIP